MVSGQSSPVITDPSPSNEPRVGTHPSYSCSQSGSSFSKGMLVTIPKKKCNSGKYEDILSNDWLLDAMKSSSPPPNRFIKDPNLGSTSDDADFAYSSWMVKHPSALSSLEQITKYANDKKIVIFLDYDGTLSPIVDDPDRAFMSNDMRSTVESVAKYFPTAIISGRSRDKVYDLVRLAKLYYAGSHGMDIMAPLHNNGLYNSINSTNNQGKEVTLFQPATEFLPMIDEVVRNLVEVTRDIEGAIVENHKFCASVHYRNVEEKIWPTIAQRVHDTLKVYPRLRLTPGRKVLEVRPVIDWDKGKALEFLLASLGLKDNNNVLAIYIGDDRTDEDAFKVLREGKRGYGILVSQFPKETKASYSLRDPSEVKQFLNGLVKWIEQKQRNS